MKENKKTEDILSRKELKENPFGVPAGYFQMLEGDVMQKIRKEGLLSQGEVEQTPAPALGFLNILKPALSLAAVFAIIFGLGYGAMSLTDTLDKSQEGQTEMVAEQSLDLSSGTELSEEEISTIIGNDIEELISGERDTVGVGSQLDEEMIEQYLIDTRVSSSILASLDY